MHRARRTGDGTGGTQLYRDPSPPPNTPVFFPVYGRVLPQQRNARVGLHQDTLLVTI